MAPPPGAAMLRPSPPEVKMWGRPPLAVLRAQPGLHDGAGSKGVTPRIATSYNDLVMSMVSDAAQQTQFASPRVLAALPGLSPPLSRQSSVASPPQPLR